MEAPRAERAFVEFHCHSTASFDSLNRPQDLVRVAAQRGITHLAITDHERLEGALEARELAPDSLVVIVGEEIRSRDGDVIGLYLEEAVPPGLSALETIDAIHAQGGLAGLPHPFDRFRSSGLAGAETAWADELAERLDYVEAYNARVAYPPANVRAAEFAHRFKLPGVAASDAHSLLEVGVAYTSLPGPIATADDMRAALTTIELVTGRASLVARALMPAVKVVQRLRGNRRVRPTTLTGRP
jgi:predicted metal-dependent phosphoesterase TrpH